MAGGSGLLPLPTVLQALRGAQGSGLFNGSKAPQSDSAETDTNQGSGMLKGVDGIYGVGPPQPPQNNSIPQFKNPYGAPTITNPYSPEDRRQFGFQIPHQLQMNQQRPQFQQQTNTDLLRRLGNPMPGTPEHRLRYPETGTPEFEQLHGPGANAEAQRPRESGPITTMPISPYPNQGQAGFGQLMGGSMGAILNSSRQGPGPGQFGYGDGPGGAPQMSQQQQQMLMERLRQMGQAQGQGSANPALISPAYQGPSNGLASYMAGQQGTLGGMTPAQQFNPYMQQQRPNPYMQQQRPNPYQMYGGLGSLFGMQDAYSQRPAPRTQAQSNEANRQLLERYKATAQQPAQQPVQQQPVQQQPYYDTQMYHG